MENLNAEQVKKWLEICAEDTPYPDQSQALLAALALINSQEQRIKELAEENERLKKSNTVLIEDNHILSSECIPRAKVDTVREMQERLKAKSFVESYSGGDCVFCDDIDQIAKEMLEGVE